MVRALTWKPPPRSTSPACGRNSPRIPYKLIFPAPYRKREQAFLNKHPNLRERYFKTLLLLEQNPMHPSLRLHPLQGRLAGLHSVSISLQYRMTVELAISEQEIVFIDVGTHGEVY